MLGEKRTPGYSLDFLTEEDTKFDSMLMNNSRDFAQSLLGDSNLLAAQKPVEDLRAGFGDATSPFKSKALEGKPKPKGSWSETQEKKSSWMFGLGDAWKTSSGQVRPGEKADE